MILDIDTVPVNALSAAPWRANWIVKADQRLLAQSMIQNGWISPLLVRKSDQTLIDGHHRWLLLLENKKVLHALGKQVPVVWIDCDEIDAMLIHVQMNLGRGRILADRLSAIIKLIYRSGKYSEHQIQDALKLNDDEYDAMLESSIFKKRKVAEHQYSPAWVPVEVSSDAKDNAITIERPPNPDS
jgi:ParB-like chromosome segregation protein Spo0J